MQIKKQTFYIAIVSAVFVIAAISIGYYCYEKEHRRQREVKEYFAYIERMVEREYESLKYDYDSYIDTITDWDYSYDFRKRYISKLNKLLGYGRYDILNFYSTYKDNREEDLELLKNIARRNVLNKMTGKE